MVMSGILALPEDCIAAVISFTSPRDAGRLACVSTTFRSAADSDGVWDSFVPRENLSANSSLSKKELYLHSCHYLNDGKLCFWFDLPSGKKCYMISARGLNIFDLFWLWVPLVWYQQRFGIPDGRMKHVGIDYRFIRDQVQSGSLHVAHVSSEDQLADALTKPLPRTRFLQLKTKIRAPS
ncbi:hypothetical protein LWI29_018924 [Acer saccharum]|uniref:F-box domain-containing protein n=1 Tax=Acer saccharum TaxID=4024 RepID=A0AA39RQH8_ACESA|nr:hypothetical protein LWI29_018924 [Acer saccharum]